MLKQKTSGKCFHQWCYDTVPEWCRWWHYHPESWYTQRHNTVSNGLCESQVTFLWGTRHGCCFVWWQEGLRCVFLIFKQSHFYVIYIILRSGGCTTSCVKTIGNGVPDPRYPGQTRTLLKSRSFDNLTTSSTHWRQCGGYYTSFHHRLHGTVGMVTDVHVVYVIWYFWN